jgi:hypothetical protein
MKFVVQVAPGRIEHDLAVAPKAAGLEMGQSPLDIDPRQAPENGRGAVPGVTVFASPRVASSGVEPEVAALGAGKSAGELTPKGMLGCQHLSLHASPPILGLGRHAERSGWVAGHGPP